MIGSIVLAAKVREKNYESRPAFGVVDYRFGQLQLALALAFAFSSLGLALSDESGAPMKFLDDEVDISYRF